MQDMKVEFNKDTEILKKKQNPKILDEKAPNMSSKKAL
jgi:hypothetical protein